MSDEEVFDQLRGAAGAVDPIQAKAAELRLLRSLGAAQPRDHVVIDRFVVLDKLGQGAHGVVYSAYDPQLDRRVALKLLGSAQGDPDRLLREARVLAKLVHPNIVTVHEVGSYASQVFVAMEFVEGGTLATWLQTDRTTLEILNVICQAAEGLAHAHAAGIIHRDFKPANVLVDRDGRARVTDFGLARAAHRGTGAQAPTVDASLATSISGGTPAYMAPEQHSGGTVDTRADQYALCLTAWEALVGCYPFADATDVHAAKLRGPEALLPRTAGLSRRQHHALQRGLSAQPDARWPDLAALLAELRPRPRGRVGAMGVMFVLGVGATAAVSWGRTDRCAEAASEIDRVWSDTHRAHLQRTFAGIGRAYATAAETRVVAALDEFATQWRQAARSVCDGASTERMRIQQQRCLEVGRIRLGAVVELLADASADVVAHADDVVAGLPSVERCGSAQPPGSGEASVDAQALAHAQQALARAQALSDAGQYDALKPALHALQPIVDQLGDPDLSGEVALLWADHGRAISDPAAAERDGMAALGFAAQAGRWDLLVSATSILCHVVGVQLERPEEGAAFARLGHQIATMHPVDWGSRALAWGAYAGSLTVLGDHDASLAEFVALSEAARKRGESWDHAIALSEAGVVTVRLGRPAEGVELLERALALATATRPLLSDHETMRIQLANALNEMGRFEEAEPLLRQARQGFVAAFGPANVDVARVDDWLGITISRLGRREDALAHFRSAEEVLAALADPPAALLAETRTRAANTLEQLGRAAEARPLFVAALELDAPPRVTELTHHFYANALARQGELQAAEHHHRAALRDAKAWGGDTRLVVLRSYALGQFLVDSNRFAEARPLAEFAWEQTRHGDVVPTHDGRIAWLWARVQAETGQPCAARASAQHASRRLAEVQDEALAAEVDAWLTASPAADCLSEQ